jgi:outer membrane protein assembly factor BamA
MQPAPGARVGQPRLLVHVSALALAIACTSCSHEQARGRRWVHDVTLSGNKSFPSSDILDRLATRATSRWPFAAKHWFDDEALDVDVDRVKAFYAAHGYFDALVIGHEVKERPDGSVDVSLQVEEGPPTRIEEIELDGLVDLPVARGGSRLSRLPIHAGDVFNHDKYLAAKQGLLVHLKEGGYAYAKVEGDVAVDRDKHEARIKLVADPGPFVRFGEPHFQGNDGIPAHALKTRVTFNPGEAYHPQDLKTTQGRLYDLGVFSTVQVQIPEQPTPVADVDIRVHPGQLHELRLGGGAGAERDREEVRLRAEWRWMNFLGGLRELRVRVRPAYVVVPSIFNPVTTGPAAENDVQLKQPDIFNTNVTAHGLVGYDLGIAEGYQYHGPRLQLGIDRPFFHEHVLAGASWNLQYLNFFNINEAVFNPVTTPLGFGFQNPYRLAYLEEFAQLDLRDRPLDPTSGAYFIVRFEQGLTALAGDFDYVKVTPDLRLYLPLSRRIVFAVRGLVGWLGPSQMEFSPITRRYALGGPASHRGFSYGRLAPQVVDPKTGDHIPVGGDGELLFSGDLRFELVRVRDNWLGMTLFVDAGDVTPTFSQLDPGNLNVAVGPDLTYQTPVGNVRAGLGVRLNRVDNGPPSMPNPDPGERLAFHLSIGEAF